MKTNVEISVADLKTVLPGLSKIVSKRASLPVLGCVKLTLNPDHTLHIQANDLDQIVTARLNKPFPGKPGEMLVPFHELSSIAKRCPATDTIELSVDGKETAITYPAAGTRIKKPLNHLDVGEFPPNTVVDTEPVQLDHAFKEALQQAFDCTSVDSGRYVLQGACLDVTNKEAHYVVGTNGSHLFSANSFLFDIPESVIVKPGKFLTWDGFVDDGQWTLRFQPEIKAEPKAKIAGKPAWVRLDSEHWTYVAKPIEGNYPNWKQVVPPSNVLKSHITLGEPGTKMILEALPLLPGQDERGEPVTLEIKGEHLTLKATSNQKDWTEIPIPAKVSGVPVTLSMNRAYLAKALKFGFTQIDIEAKHSPVVFTAKGKIMIICPFRPPETEKVAGTPTTPLADNTATASNSSATSTPAQQPAPQPTTEALIEERTEMPRTAKTSTPPETITRETRPVETEINSNGTQPAVKSLVDQVEGIKDGLRGIIRDLSGLADTVKQAEKEKKATEREIEAVRTKLRQIQNVNI